jgi:hypothetical protein
MSEGNEGRSRAQDSQEIVRPADSKPQSKQHVAGVIVCLNTIYFAKEAVPQHMRLEAASVDAWRRMSAFADRNVDTKDSREVLGCCCKLLDMAKKAGEKRKFYVAFDCILQIDVELLKLFDEVESRTVWYTLLNEAHQKLKGWRKEAVNCISKDVGDRTPSLAHIRQVMMHLHAESQNKQHKIDLLNEHVKALFWLIGGTIAFLMIGTIIDKWFDLKLFDWLLKKDESATFIELFLSGTLAGLLGAVLSITFAALHLDLEGNIPVLRSALSLTFLRAAIGAIVALPVIMIGFGIGEIANYKLILMGCLLAGFSERWFTKQLEKMIDKWSLEGEKKK